MFDEDKDIEEEILDVEVCEVCTPKEPKKILMVVTSADRFDEHHKTGVWFEEFAVPFLDFLDNGYIVTVASPKGGAAPIDPKSEHILEDIKWKDAKKALNDTVPINTVDFTLYDALVIPGGHGPILDLYKDEDLAKIVEDYSKRHKLIAAICHGPAGFLSAKTNKGIPFVNGKKVTSFTNDEEAEAKMNNLVTFFIEDALKDQGAFFMQKPEGEIFVVEDDNLITAQNYQSSEQFAQAIMNYLDRK